MGDQLYFTSAQTDFFLHLHPGALCRRMTCCALRCLRGGALISGREHGTQTRVSRTSCLLWRLGEDPPAFRRTVIITSRASSCRSLIVKCQIVSFMLSYPSIYAHVSTICYQHAALLPLYLPPAPVQPLLLFFKANRRCQLL